MGDQKLAPPPAQAAEAKSLPVARDPQPAAPPIQKGSAPPAAVKSHFWLTRLDQFVLALLLTILSILSIVYWIRLTNWGTAPIEIDRLEARKYEFRFDVNSATWVEFGQLEGIGDSLAHRIVEDRERNGPFSSVDDLQRVKGIGPKTIERIRPFLTIGDQSLAPPARRAKKR
jgi:competence protein ComEA